jgi:signal transduction histidine kinase
MKKPGTAFLRGLTVQLFATTVLPLTLLLLVIAFGGVYLHEQDMRSLISERDERAVQAAAATLESELHHRAASITVLAALAELSTEPTLVHTTDDIEADFDGGLAYLDDSGQLIAAAGSSGLWNGLIQEKVRLASASDLQPVFSAPFPDPRSKRLFVIVSQYSASRNIIVAGAFSGEKLASETLLASYPARDSVTIYLLDPSGRLLFASGVAAPESLLAQHVGVAEALRGESGTRYVQVEDSEHVIAYSPIPLTGWALLTEEDWQAVVSPSLQVTQIAPLVFVPAFVLALFALWFGVRQIVQPLQRLESKAAALAWGDFEPMKESVGGISEVQHLQHELTEMARKVQAAQAGLHDYIGAITSAQEEERMRLARELHDDTIQAVIALKQRVQLAQKSVKDQNARKSLIDLETLAEQTIENLRRLTRALRPIYLEDLGLVPALEMLTKETSHINHLHVGFHQSGKERRLPRETELALYRIAQEALSNVVHHAKAKHADIQLLFNDQIKLEVTDDGVGFSVPKSPTDFAPSGHFGLLGMRERADLIGAKLDVESEAGRGTRLSVRLAAPSSMSKRKRRETIH